MSDRGAVTEGEPASDRDAVIELIVSYFNAIDAKDWDRLEDVFTDDVTVWWNEEISTSGREAVLARMRQMLATEDIVNYHLIGQFPVTISGDRAEAPVSVRVMHHGRNSRAGRFWESLAVQTTQLTRSSQGWRCSGFSWRMVVGLGSMDLFDGLRPEPAPTHGWPEVYEKFEYASPEWVEMLRELILEGVAGQDLTGVEFALCEEYTNAPAHLLSEGRDTVGLLIRVEDGEVKVTSDVIDGSAATKKLICDYESAKRYAMRYPDPPLRDELIAEGLMRFEGEGDMSKLPAFWLALDTTSLIRPRTAW